MSEKKIVTRVVVGAVIIERQKVLLLQRNAEESTYPNLWELPSGKKHHLEKIDDALAREVKEETGLTVTKAIPFYVFDYQIERPLEIRDSVQINYLTSVTDPHRVAISREHQNFVWASREDIPKYGVTDLTAETLKRAFDLICS
jgi:8-oxo-dGTP diphosphatase